MDAVVWDSYDKEWFSRCGLRRGEQGWYGMGGRGRW